MPQKCHISLKWYLSIFSFLLGRISAPPTFLGINENKVFSHWLAPSQELNTTIFIIEKILSKCSFYI